MSNNLKELSRKLDDYKLKKTTKNKNKNKSKVSSTPFGLGLKI